MVGPLGGKMAAYWVDCSVVLMAALKVVRQAERWADSRVAAKVALLGATLAVDWAGQRAGSSAD